MTGLERGRTATGQERCSPGQKAGATTVTILLLLTFLVGVDLPAAEVSAIQYTIIVLDPNGGESWVGAMDFEIMVYTSTVNGVIVLSYSTNGGETYPNEIDVIPNVGGTQRYSWRVPNNINSTHVKVRADWRSQEGDPSLLWASDESNGNLTITPGVTLEFLEVPDVMSYGRYSLVRWGLWDGLQIVGGLSLQARYRTDTTWGDWVDLGGIFANIAPSQGGIWYMPDYYESAYGQLRITAYTEIPGGTLITDAESEEFEISSPWVELVYPTGGQTLVGGSVCTITWASANDEGGIISGAFLEYSIDGGVNWVFIDGRPNDWSYDWTVPSGMSSDHVRVRVGLYHTEWAILTTDESDSDLRIIESADVPSVTLITPNPHIPGNIVYRHGEVTWIRWSATCFEGGISDFRILLSTDNGSTYSPLMNASAASRAKAWTVPALDTMEAKIKIEMRLTDTRVVSAESSNPFYIFTETVWNRPPVAIAPEDLNVLEGQSVTLDGSASYDPDGDPLTYLWEVVDSLGFPVTLAGANTAVATFVPNIRDIVITMMFRLTVSDGQEINVEHYTDHMKVTSVRVAPAGPSISGFTPSNGFEGTKVCINGTNLMGAQVRINGVLTATVPTAPTPSDPNPDRMYNFTLVPGIPIAPGPITVTTRAGTATSGEDLDVHPRPWYCLDHGFNMYNTNKYFLSYPWAPWNDGDYRRTFGNDVYINIWVCVGIPYWTFWDGWECAGYLIEEPIAPDPFAALYYGAAYCYLARSGECFGFSSVSLELYHDLIDPNDLQPGAYDVDDLTLTGAFRDRVDYMHGSQVSAECLRGIVGEHLGNLLATGLPIVLLLIKGAIDSGNLGVVCITEGVKGHVMVPYEIVDIDADTTRIYVWDINKPEWSTAGGASAALLDTNPDMAHPPYIEIDKSGMYWEWSYYISPDTGWWGGPMGLTFLPASVVLGDRSLPTTLDGALALVFGCASGEVEDEEGNRLAIGADGEWVMEIANGTPLPAFGDVMGSQYSGYYMPAGNYTVELTGREEGSYNCVLFSGAKAAYAIENVEGGEGTHDTLRLFQRDGNPFMGTMTYQTSDEEKGYSATMTKRFGERERVFKIINATLFEGDRAIINTTEDYCKLVFQNDGDHSFAFDVRFQGNVLSAEAWERLNGTLTDLPTCEAFGIEIGPHETLTIYPSDWLDLESAEVIVEREGDGGLDVLYIALLVAALVAAVAVLWYLAVGRKKKRD